MKYRLLLAVVAVAAAPALLHARSAIGAPTQRVGIASEGGLTCAVCHSTFGGPDTDPRGRLVIQAAAYQPGVKQKIRVMLSHPEASRWGFELTARLASDDTKPAGTFTSGGEVQVKCGPSPGSVDACNDTVVQFATHTGEGTHAGTLNGSTWEIEWTPPATNVGEVVFYAAGNAANNSGTPAGDHIYTTRKRVQAAEGCSFSAAPRVNAVVNGASFQPGIGFNGLISIFGTGFAPAGTSRGADQFDFEDDRFPQELGCISVEVNGVHVPVIFVNEFQINAQAPAVVLSGPVKVEIRQNRGRAKEAKAEMSGIRMEQFAPAFFVIGSSKSIAARHNDGTAAADASVGGGAAPARPGEVVSLYGTGFGVTDPVWQPGELPSVDRAGRIATQFTVQIGGVTLRPEDISYAGLAPLAISGLYQFNVRIPDSAPDGNAPVVIRIGGVGTQDGAYIPVKR